MVIERYYFKKLLKMYFISLQIHGEMLFVKYSVALYAFTLFNSVHSLIDI